MQSLKERFKFMVNGLEDHLSSNELLTYKLDKARVSSYQPRLKSLTKSFNTKGITHLVVVKGKETVFLKSLKSFKPTLKLMQKYIKKDFIFNNTMHEELYLNLPLEVVHENLQTLSFIANGLMKYFGLKTFNVLFKEDLNGTLVIPLLENSTDSSSYLEQLKQLDLLLLNQVVFYWYQEMARCLILARTYLNHLNKIEEQKVKELEEFLKNNPHLNLNIWNKI